MKTPSKKHLNILIQTDENQKKIRADKWISQYLNQQENLEQAFSRSQIQQWIAQQFILIDGQAINNKTQIGVNQTIKINVDLVDSQSQQNWKANKIEIPFEIIYQDDDLLIINKPAGLVVHPGAGHWNDTLINGLLLRYPELENIPRNGVIHRIDKDTSGLLCIAKNSTSHHRLTQQMNERKIEKIYFALVNGNVISGGEIKAPIARSTHNRLKQVVHEKGKSAITQYTVIEKFHSHSLLRVNLLTGRTHQIRVHLKHIGFPIVGDSLYHMRRGNLIPKGSSEALIQALQSFKRQALHAYQLKFLHPTTQKMIAFKTEIPTDFKNLLNLLSQS